jgi:hypothetical protein
MVIAYIFKPQPPLSLRRVRRMRRRLRVIHYHNILKMTYELWIHIHRCT